MRTVLDGSLEVLPGAILISPVAPAVVFGGISEWAATVAVPLVAIRTGSIVPAMAVGMSVVWIVRNGAGAYPTFDRYLAGFLPRVSAPNPGPCGDLARLAGGRVARRIDPLRGGRRGVI